MHNKKRIFFIISVVFFAICIGVNFYSSLDYYRMYSTQFTNLDKSFMSARYLESTNGKGIIVVGDLEHNKGELSMLVSEFSNRGYGVWIFDFPSQGLSENTIPFNYKEKDSNYYLAEQFYSSIVAYTQLANMTPESIHVIGYGEGARSILETASRMDDIKKVSGITLVGIDINLTEKINFDFLSFTNDKDLEWVNSLSITNPGLKINLIASKLDRASKVKDNEELKKILEENKLSLPSNEQTPFNNVTLSEVTLVPHSSLMSSSTVLSVIMEQLEPGNAQLSILTRINTPMKILTYIFFILSLFFAGELLKNPESIPISTTEKKKSDGLIKSKLYVHLPGLVVAGLIAIGLYLIPIPFPYFRIFHIAMIAAYGFIMLVMYKLTTFSNNLGSSFTKKDNMTRMRWVLLNLVIILALITIISLSRSELFLSFLIKPIWLLILVLLFIPLFYIDERERRLFTKDRKFCLKLLAINYLIVLILPIIFTVMGLFDNTFIMISIAGCLIISLSTEFITRPLGFSSRASAFVKSIVFVLLCFPNISMFY